MTLLEEVIAETNRFLSALEKIHPADNENNYLCPLRAHVKRASMDLTRKLAQLRKTPGSDWTRRNND